MSSHLRHGLLKVYQRQPPMKQIQMLKNRQCYATKIPQNKKKLVLSEVLNLRPVEKESRILPSVKTIAIMAELPSNEHFFAILI